MPATRVVPEARSALEQHAPGSTITDVSGDEFAYARVIRELWEGGEDFVIVEHDLVIRDDVLPAFAACPEPWCYFADDGLYVRSDQPVIRNGFWGCVRFRAEIMAAVPHLCDIERDEPAGERIDWGHVAATYGTLLYRRGFEAHRHDPGLRHLHVPHA